MPDQDISRRRFVQATTVGASSLAMGLPRHVLGANEKIDVALIGCGGRGRTLLKSLGTTGEFRVVAVCDLKQDRADQAAAICEENDQDAKTYLDFRKMLDQEKPDACIVATEEGNHAKCAIPVLEADLHCFCEKPMDVTAEKVKKVVAAARKSKGIYQIGFQRRYATNFQKTIDYIHNEELGKTTFLQGHWHFPYGPGGRYLDLDLSGPWLLAQACHHMDVFMWVMKDQHPLQCTAMASVTVDHPTAPARGPEDHSGVVWSFPGNVNCSFAHLMNCCDEFCGERLWVHCEKGGVDMPAGMVYPRRDVGEPRRLAEDKSGDYYVGTAQQFVGFAQHIRNNETPRNNEVTGALSTLMGIMACTSMYNDDKNKFEAHMLKWEDLGVTL